MKITLSTPTPASLGNITNLLTSWQSDVSLNHIHPGDLGWFQRFGAEKTAANIRIWSRASDGFILAIGLLDGDDLLRATTAPSARRDEALACAMAADINDPAGGVLPAGQVSFDIAADALVREHILAKDGWAEGEEWTWMRMDLTNDVPLESNLRLETVKTQEQVCQRANVQTLSFKRSSFTVERWHAMAKSPAYELARCFLAYDDNMDPNEAVGTLTVWSAGEGKPAILEPVGVSASHQGRGLGRAMCRAAAGELKRMGASSAVVNTPSWNVSAVAAYKGAGFVVAGTRKDLCRAK